MYKSPCCDRYVFADPYTTIAFVIHSFYSSLITFDYIALNTHLDIIKFITYIPIQLYNYKIGHNIILHKYYKVVSNVNT